MKLRRVAPIAKLPKNRGSYHLCPLNRGRFTACARQAELGLTRERPDTTRAATRRAVLAAETLRGAVSNGQARQQIADFLRAHYERAAAIAARLDDPDLVLEVAERLRTERITALLARHTDLRLPHELDAVLDQIDRLNEQLARTMAPSGLTAVRALPATPDVRDVDAARLEADLAAARRKLADLTGQAFADIYDAPPAQVGDLLDGLALDVLAILPLDDGEREYVVTVWWPAPGPTGRQTTTRPAVRLTPVDRDLRNLRSWLTDRRPTARIGQHAAQLKPITNTLPTQLTALLNTDSHVRPMLVVPGGWLWGVPFPALPLTDDLTLIDRVDLALTPSLRVHAATRPRLPAEKCRTVVSFALPEFAGSDDLMALSQFPEGHDELSDVAQLVTAVTKGGSQWQLAVLATHGNREPGLAQGLLTTDRSTLLTASQFLTPEARPPAVLSVAACHGLYPPGDDPHEPLGLAVCALAAGASEIISTHSELDFGPVAARILADTYLSIAEGTPAWVALSRAQRRVPGHTALPLARWAVLATLVAGNATAHAERRTIEPERVEPVSLEPRSVGIMSRGARS